MSLILPGVCPKLKFVRNGDTSPSVFEHLLQNKTYVCVSKHWPLGALLADQIICWRPNRFYTIGPNKTKTTDQLFLSLFLIPFISECREDSLIIYIWVGTKQMIRGRDLLTPVSWARPRDVHFWGFLPADPVWTTTAGRQSTSGLLLPLWLLLRSDSFIDSGVKIRLKGWKQQRQGSQINPNIKSSQMKRGTFGGMNFHMNFVALS